MSTSPVAPSTRARAWPSLTWATTVFDVPRSIPTAAPAPACIVAVEPIRDSSYVRGPMSGAAHDRDTTATQSLVGRTIAGKFRVESFVGKGAMGAVFKATQLTLKKRVAIKVMNPDKKDGTYASRFKRE